jgi:hypothetical protein
MKKYSFLIFLLLTITGFAQDIKPFTPSGEANYYNFWEGNWYKVVNDKPDITSTHFKVSKGIHPAAWMEEWDMVIDSTLRIKASAIRAWDKTNNKWMYTWVSDNGLFQVWEGRKVDNDWYIYKEFDINGDKYLSRQGWIPMEKNKLMRISEKSYDNGKTWQLRFKEFYVKL